MLYPVRIAGGQHFLNDAIQHLVGKHLVENQVGEWFGGSVLAAEGLDAVREVNLFRKNFFHYGVHDRSFRQVTRSQHALAEGHEKNHAACTLP